MGGILLQRWRPRVTLDHHNVKELSLAEILSPPLVQHPKSNRYSLRRTALLGASHITSCAVTMVCDRSYFNRVCHLFGSPIMFFFFWGGGGVQIPWQLRALLGTEGRENERGRSCARRRPQQDARGAGVDEKAAQGPPGQEQGPSGEIFRAQGQGMYPFRAHFLARVSCDNLSEGSDAKRPFGRCLVPRSKFEAGRVPYGK